MGKNKRRNFSTEFKVKVAARAVAIEALKEQQALSELAAHGAARAVENAFLKKSYCGARCSNS